MLISSGLGACVFSGLVMENHGATMTTLSESGITINILADPGEQQNVSMQMRERSDLEWVSAGKWQKVI